MKTHLVALQTRASRMQTLLWFKISKRSSGEVCCTDFILWICMQDAPTLVCGFFLWDPMIKVSLTTAAALKKSSPRAASQNFVHCNETGTLKHQGFIDYQPSLLTGWFIFKINQNYQNKMTGSFCWIKELLEDYQSVT